MVPSGKEMIVIHLLFHAASDIELAAPPKTAKF